jgi:simple sugar transport system permease protein
MTPDTSRNDDGMIGGVSLVQLLQRQHGELFGLAIILAAVLVFFAAMSPRFLTLGTFQSITFQLPVLGLLTLAMLMPIVSGGFNLAVTFTANIAGLAMAWVLQSMGGPDAGITAFGLAVAAALAAGTLAGWVMGMVIAHTGAHPILVSLSMMIFLRGLGEFLTRGGDVSGFPEFVSQLGHGTVAGVPIPMLIFVTCVLLWRLLLTRTRLGFATYMVGSNPVAARYSGIDTKRTLTLIYTLSGFMCAIAGIVMATRFNSVRVGHGEAFLLITVLACFLGGVDPFGGFGRVAPVVLALVILQIISSGLNLLGANQHLATALWGGFLIAVMVARWLLWYLRGRRRST